MRAVSLNILLDPIDPEKLAFHIPRNKQHAFYAIDYLPERDEEKPDSGILYAGKLSRAMSLRSSSPDFFCVCIRDRIPDERETDEALRGLIVLNENYSVHKLHRILQDQLLKINDWVYRLQKCLLARGGYQELFDVSEDVLENSTQAIDAGYKLVAHTKNHLSDDPINVSLMEKGYHDEEAMKAIQNANRFYAYENELDIIINPPRNPTIYATVSKWIRFANTPYIHVIMICNNRPPLPSIVDLFAIFAEFMGTCFHLLTENNRSGLSSYYSLFADMAFNDLSDPRIIAERAKCINLPVDGNFDVCHIVFEDNNKVPVGRFIDELLTFIPASKIIFRNFEVIVFNAYSDSSSGFFGAYARSVEKHFIRYGAICGISERFTSLPDFTIACNQAKRTQALGYKLRIAGDYWGFSEGVYKNAFPARHERIFRYDDIFPYLMIHCAQTGALDVFANNRYVEAVGNLRGGETDRADDSARVLYIYLISECSPTAAGKILCMNRNNVIYRIMRIEEQLGMDLSDYETRFRLLLAYKYWETQHLDTIN